MSTAFIREEWLNMNHDITELRPYLRQREYIILSPVHKILQLTMSGNLYNNFLLHNSRTKLNLINSEVWRDYPNGCSCLFHGFSSCLASFYMWHTVCPIRGNEVSHQTLFTHIWLWKKPLFVQFVDFQLTFFWKTLSWTKKIFQVKHILLYNNNNNIVNK